VPLGKFCLGNTSPWHEIGLLGINGSVITAAIFGILATPFINHPLPFVQLPRYVA